MGETIKYIANIVKSVLSADPHEMFKKERHLVNKPFYFEGINGKAILLLHGWTSTAYEVRRLGLFLNGKGYTVVGPMLTGHGTMPKDLEGVKWEQWVEDAEKSYLELRQKHEKVYVGGTSIGANLSMVLAKRYPEIAGVILMATPYRMRFEGFVLFLAKFLLLFKNYNKKFYPPSFGSKTTVTRSLSYQAYPIKSVLEAFEIVRESRKNLDTIKQPCLLIQSSTDHIVDGKSMEYIYKQIGSTIKKKKYIEKAYHTFISDIRNEHVFSNILGFISEN